jgi:hypothetical protein
VCPFARCVWRAQPAQIQALLRAAAGTRASNSALKSTWVHQQGGWGFPVARAVSMAQALGLPHKGQRVGPSAAGAAPSATPVPAAVLRNTGWAFSHVVEPVVE